MQSQTFKKNWQATYGKMHLRLRPTNQFCKSSMRQTEANAFAASLKIFMHLEVILNLNHEHTWTFNDWGTED